MAYLKDDPKKDQQDEVQANVLGDDGAQATSSGGSIQSSGQSQSSGGTSVTSAGQTAPQGAIRAGTGGRSGQFTDVKQYVDKNRPQGARIAAEAGKGVTSQAADIGKQITARKSALQDVLDQNQAQVQRDSAFATQQIQQAAATPAPVVMGPSDDQVAAETAATQAAENQARFSEIMGQGTQLQATPELNLASQEIAARRLGQQEFNTQNLLQDAFAKPGRQYTAGQQKLDELLLGGTGFGSQLQETARQASKTALGDIASLRQQAIEDTAQQGIDQGQLSTDVMAQIEAARSGIVDPIQARVDAAKSAREGLSTEFQNIMKTSSDRMSDLKNIYGSSNTPEFNKMLVQKLRNSGLQSLAGLGVESDRYQLSEQDIKELGIDKNWYDQGVGVMRTGNSLDSPHMTFANQLRSKILNAADPAAMEKELMSRGITPDQLSEAKDLNVTNFAQQEDIARYNALQKLAGSEDIMMPEAKEDYLSAEDLQTMIDKYYRAPKLL